MEYSWSSKLMTAIIYQTNFFVQLHQRFPNLWNLSPPSGKWNQSSPLVTWLCMVKGLPILIHTSSAHTSSDSPLHALRGACTPTLGNTGIDSQIWYFLFFITWTARQLMILTFKISLASEMTTPLTAVVTGSLQTLADIAASVTLTWDFDFFLYGHSS